MTGRRRVLLVTYYWPPSGGSGVQRTLKFAKYLGRSGWEPVVLTVHPEHAAFPDRDDELERDVPADVSVIRTRSWDPYSAYARWTGQQKSQAVGTGFLGDAVQPGLRERTARWVRANLFLPDARAGWVPFARRAASRAIHAQPIHAVVTSGPPQSAHLVGSWVKARFGTPWIADLRDAWPDMSYRHMMPTTTMAESIDNRIRQRTLARADVRITVSDDVARFMESETGLSFQVIPNGFDPDDMASGPQKTLSGFTIVHTGNMSPARNPSPLWNVLAEDAWPELRVLLVGNVDGGIRKEVADRELSDVVELHAYVPHSEAIAYMKAATLLLLPINRVQDGAGIVTGKIYEYVASGRPVLGLGEPGGEADRILRESGAGRVFAYDDPEGITRAVKEHFQAWKSGYPVPGASPERALPWSRREQTDRLADILNGLI